MYVILAFMREEKYKTKIKDVFILQAVFIIFSMSTICIKLASNALFIYDSIFIAFFSFRFILPMFLAVFILGVYALIWQQIIKRFDLSIAYANKATTLLWSLVWGFTIFNETITPAKIIGVVIVFVGVVIMNSEAVS